MGLIDMKVMDEIGRRLVRFLIFGLVSLVVVQGLMTRDNIRFYLSLGERLEGERVAVPTAALDASDQAAEVPCSISSPGSFTLMLQDYSRLEKVKILVNGQEMGSMALGRVKLYVTSGDVVELDTRAYEHPVTFKVTNVTPNLAFPLEGMTFTSQQSLSMLGKIRVR